MHCFFRPLNSHVLGRLFWQVFNIWIQMKEQTIDKKFKKIFFEVILFILWSLKSIWQQAMLHGKPDLQQYKESKVALKTLLERNTCELMKVDLWRVELVLEVRLVITDLEKELEENGSFISSLKCVKYICNYNERWRKQRALIIQKRKKKKNVS